MGGQDNWRANGSGVAINFDGANDYVVGSDGTGLAGNVPWTFAAWLLSTATSGTLVYCGGGTASGLGLLVRLSTSGNMIYSGGATGCTATGMFDSGQWTHVSFVYPGTVIRDTIAFKNGVSRGAVTEGSLNAGNVAANFTRQSMWLGAISGTGTFLNGQLDDVRIYNRALTAVEIRLLASRRGIGLTPLPDRAAGLPKKLSVNVGGTWRNGDSYVNTGSGWRLGVPFVNVAGTWR
jgi:hypothetical protein